jgi:hypothetical protein
LKTQGGYVEMAKDGKILDKDNWELPDDELTEIK